MHNTKEITDSNVVSITVCPICSKPSLAPADPDAPFCSHRCALLDLGNWLSGDYRIPSEESADEPKPIEDF